MKEFAVYTLWRLGLFVVAYAAVVGVYLLVTGGGSVPIFWPFMVAIVLSATASWFLLRRQRDRFAMAVHERASRASHKFDEKFEQIRAKEDQPRE